MIALWMAYALVSGTLIAMVCWLLEHIGRVSRISTRWIWAVGMLMMLVIPGAALLTERRAPPASSPRVPVVEAQVAGGGRAASEGFVRPVQQRTAQLLQSVEKRIATATLRLSPWDHPLLVLWAVLSAFLGGVVAHAALEGRRLRYGLQPRDVDGTPVLLTEHIGPSAIGIGSPAILIPRWVLDLDDALLRLVVRHEREHLAARDPLLLLSALLPIVLVPWHLPLWWIRKRLWLAVEVDCDRRVLRAHPDVRRYAQLLLLTAQRAPNTALANLAVVTVIAPLQPHASHLARRILAMTQPPRSRVLLRAIPLFAGAAAIASLLMTLPAPHLAQAQSSVEQERAVVRLTSVGIEGLDAATSILVYTTGSAQVGLGTEQPTILTSTLRLTSLPAMTADVTGGEVHIQVSGPGMIRVGGQVTGGPALEVSASGRHIVLLQGGVGIDTRR